MIVICVYVHVKPDEVDSFIDATVANHLRIGKRNG